MYDIIVKPILSEKSNALENVNKYTFVARNYANKTNLKLAFENIFKIEIRKVNIINIKSNDFTLYNLLKCL